VEVEVYSAAINGVSCLFHTIGTISPTRNTYAPADTNSAIATHTKARKKEWVCNRITPVTIGEATPPMLPAAFCTPDHFPAAVGPASVCVIAHTLELNKPSAQQAVVSKAIAKTMLLTIAAGSTTVQSSNPVITKPLRTRVALKPYEIRRSDAQPQLRAETPPAQKGSAPKNAIDRILMCRSITKYEGNQERRKYQT